MHGAIGDLSPQAKYPLHRLGYKNRAVRKALGALARDGADGEFRLFFLMAVAFMGLQSAPAGKRSDDDEGRDPAPTAQCKRAEQRARKRAGQHEENRSPVEVPAVICIAWRSALRRRSGRSGDRHRQDVRGISRRNGEDKVGMSALGEPRRCQPVGTVGALRGLDGTAGGFDFDGCTGHRFVGGKPVEIDLEIFAADDRDDLEGL